MADSSPIYVDGQTADSLLSGSLSIQEHTVSILLVGEGQPS
ncbi:hypothetical protein P9869_39230 [Streptomyces ossamyceticus]|nr:hypothetical protein [Streptomyces ossamyceticus]